ncbi:retrovirus-related pol polyprotein from transposon TNT 1-94 [Tanacetum coccineum]
MIRRHYGKTPYELLHDKPPDLSYLHVFGALCYPTNDSENLGKLQPKADIVIFVPYAPSDKAPPDHQVSEHNSKWTKDHPLENKIVEPKNYKDALTQACWIEAMQEELHEFECLKVWELVPPPDKAFVITLKWIYKVKLDELGGI